MWVSLKRCVTLAAFGVLGKQPVERGTDEVGEGGQSNRLKKVRGGWLQIKFIVS